MREWIGGEEALWKSWWVCQGGGQRVVDERVELARAGLVSGDGSH